MAAFACIGVVAILFCLEPLNAAAETGTGSVGVELRTSVIAPLADFFRGRAGAHFRRDRLLQAGRRGLVGDADAIFH